MQVRRGDLIRVTFYDRDGYVTRAGVVAGVETVFHRLRLGTRSIPFDDICAIERHAES